MPFLMRYILLLILLLINPIEIMCFTGQLFAQYKLLILRNSGKAFEEVVKGIVDDLGDDIIVEDKVLDREVSMNKFADLITDCHPNVLVLMDNYSINLYREYLENQSDSVEIIPSVSLMAVYLDKVIKGLKNATGIQYEVPAVISGVNLRAISKSPIEKIGVVYRKLMEDFYYENKQFCQTENIELVGVQLSNSRRGKATEVQDALKQLFEHEQIDALWVINDNILLDIETIQDVWIPMIEKYEKPVIVGVELLVDSKLNFGTFAVLPDHYALGMQAAGMVFDLLENNRNLSGQSIEQPYSVIKILNLKQAKKVIDIDKNRLNSIDKILK